MEDLTLLHIAAMSDSLECFIFLIANDFEFNIKNAKNYLPIHYACYFNSLEVVTYILSVHPELSNYHDDDLINFHF